MTRIAIVRVSSLVIKILVMIEILLMSMSVSAKGFWPESYEAAIVLTYDDALESQIEYAIPELNSQGMKATFFLAGRMIAGNVETWRQVAAEGHELGNHTINHPCKNGSFEMPVQYNTENYSLETMQTEVRVMNSYLQALDFKKSHSFAASCGELSLGEQDLIVPFKQMGFITAIRGASSNEIIDPSTMDPFVASTKEFDDNSTSKQMIGFVQLVQKNNGLSVIVFHGIGRQHLVQTVKDHKQLLEYLNRNKSKVWVATFSEVMSYIQRKRQKLNQK